MEDLYVDMKEYLKYVLDKNTDREQYIKCYHMLLCFLKGIEFIIFGYIAIPGFEPCGCEYAHPILVQ